MAPAADITSRCGLIALFTGKGVIPMFAFFSSRLGILGSIAVSIAVTLILLLVFRVIR